MKIKIQEQKVRLLNHLTNQVEQIIEFLPTVEGKYDPEAINNLHTIVAKVKSYSAKNPNSNLYKIFNKMEGIVFEMAKDNSIPSPHEIDYLKMIAKTAKDQISLIYKSLVLESNIKNVLNHNEQISEVDIESDRQKNGDLKISYGTEDISMFTESQTSLLDSWYNELTPIGKTGKELSRRTAFMDSLADLIDTKNSFLTKDDTIYKSVEELCSRLEKLQTVPLHPIVANVTDRIKDLASQIDKNVEFKLNVDNIPVPENMVNFITNLINSMLELIVVNSLESKEYRSTLGKPTPYIIELTAVNNESNFYFKIVDDGMGKSLIQNLDNISNHKANFIKEVISENKIRVQESNYLGRESVYEFEVKLSPWFFKAYHIHSAGRDYLVPLAQVKSFVPLKSKEIKDYYYMHDGEKLFYYDASGESPGNVDGKIGILHFNNNKVSQILVCDTISEPTYVRIHEKGSDNSNFIGTSKWQDNKTLSIFDIKKLCKNENGKMTRIIS